ncbi:MAG: LEPR-XLL domain-containing protein, partial [Comamonadaceae bacterium]
MASKKLAILSARLAGAIKRPGAPRPGARRKTLFEALEQRFLLSAELIIPPPQVQQPVLEAPLVINAPGQIQLSLAAQMPPEGASLTSPDAGAAPGATPAASTTAALAGPDVAQAMPGRAMALADFASYMQSRPAGTQLVIVDSSIPHVGTLLDGLLAAMPEGGAAADGQDMDNAVNPADGPSL